MNPVLIAGRLQRLEMLWHTLVTFRTTRRGAIAQGDELLALLRGSRRRALRDGLSAGVVRRCSCRRLVRLRNVRWVSPEYIGGGCYWGDCPVCGSTLSIEHRGHKKLAQLIRDRTAGAIVASRTDLELALAGLATWSRRHALVLRKRYGLDGEPTQTFKNIGAALGVSRQRAHQIHGRALEMLTTILELNAYVA